MDAEETGRGPAGAGLGAEGSWRGDQDFKTRLLFGEEALGRLKAARVMVIGVGGVGGACCLALARGGVGGLVFVDPDTVSPTNLNRQAVAFHSTMGRHKADVARDMALDVSPGARVESLRARVAPEDLPALLADPPDFVVDAMDSVTSKLALAAYCDAHGVRLVSCMGTGNKLHPELFQIADIYETSVDPLCKVMRREARARGIRRLTVLYSREQPRKVAGVPGAPRQERTYVGTASFVPPVAGMMLAGHVIRELSGVEAPGRAGL